MERKIGEIFEHNGEWCQCVEGNGCENCAFEGRKCYLEGGTDDPIGECCYDRRRDNKDVIFKKLEKVGEPYMTGNKLIQRYKIYPTTCCINVYGWYYQNLDVKSWTIDIEIKQSKEDMEEKKLNLKPFDIQKAREGKPVCTSDGRKARIICFDKQEGLPIVALVETKKNGRISEEIALFYINGRAISADIDSKHDLMMLPEKKEGWVNVYYDNDASSHRGCRFIYDTKEEAIKGAGSNYITTVKIEWTE